MTRAVFLGTPAAAVPSLRSLAAAGVDLVAVITRPDRRRGRSGRIEASPVKQAAVDLGIPVLEPADRVDLAQAVGALGFLDVGVVVAFGMILPASVLALPARGVVNVHFSLLPRWRGAAPIQRSLLADDEVGGVSLMVLDEGLDTGPVLAVAATRYGAEETAGEIEARLAAIGADLLADVLPDYLGARVTAVPQGSDGATYAPRLDREEGRLDSSDDPESFCRRVRAMTPRPGAFGLVNGERLKILAARPVNGAGSPGGLSLDGDRLVCGVGGGLVELVEVQASSRRAMSGSEWARGRRGALGEFESGAR